MKVKQGDERREAAKPMDTTTGKETFVTAIGGGKGGTGKSTVSLSIAAILALAGHRTVLADLDFGAANLHTMLGIPSSSRSIVHFLYRKDTKSSLQECLVKTGIDNLSLLPGDGFMPGMANMEFSRKQKLIRNLKQLTGDYLLCDLGAGSSYNVIDFFLAADLGMLVLTAEITAILNGYEFMKNCIFRKIIRSFRATSDIGAYIEEYRKSKSGQSGSSIQDLTEKLESRFPGTAATIDMLCRSYSPIFFFNRESANQDQLGDKLTSLAKKYLNIDILYGGTIPEDRSIGHQPLAALQDRSASPYRQKIEAVARFIEKINLKHEKQLSTH